MFAGAEAAEPAGAEATDVHCGVTWLQTDYLASHKAEVAASDDRSTLHSKLGAKAFRDRAG